MRISDWSSDVCSSDLRALSAERLRNGNTVQSEHAGQSGVDLRRRGRPDKGLIIGQPEVKFLGEIDVPSLTIGEGGQRSLSYTAVSVFERLFATDEGARAQDAWHQSIWPGAKGDRKSTRPNSSH